MAVMHPAAVIPNARLRWLLLCLLGVTAVAQTQTQATRDVFLPSGKLMRVLSVSRLNIAHQGTALVLTYQTDLNLSDLSALRKEIDEIWPVFKGDVEKARSTTAIISAKEVPQGVVLNSAGAHYFMFRKSDGEWRLVSDTAKAAGR